MSFKKLALAAAVAVAPMGAFAMQPMNDAEMSSVTGQDGITMTLDANITTDIWIEDTDGLDGTGPAGFMTLAGLNIDATGLEIKIDAGSAAGATGANTGVLQVAINIPTAITLSNLELGVQGSSATVGASADNTRLGDIADSTTVLSIGSLNLAASDIILQLGPDAGTPTMGTANLLELSGTIDLNINDVQLFGGTSNAGWIGAEFINVNNVVLDGTTANMTAAGLEVTVGPNATDIGVDISRLTLGDASTAALGNVYLTGLDVSNTVVTIAGH